MPSLKDLRVRIASVQSTKKITSAMKMVAASKLRRAQMQAEAARPYSERMERMLRALAASVADTPGAPPLLVGTGSVADSHVRAVEDSRGRLQLAAAVDAFLPAKLAPVVPPAARESAGDGSQPDQTPAPGPAIVPEKD